MSRRPIFAPGIKLMIVTALLVVVGMIAYTWLVAQNAGVR